MPVSWALVLALGICVICGHAAIVTVPCCNLGSVRSAIFLGASGDVIQLSSGTWTNAPLFNSSVYFTNRIFVGLGSVTINCGATAGLGVLNNAGTTNVTIRNMLVTNLGSNHAIFVSGTGAPVVTLDRLTISGQTWNAERVVTWGTPAGGNLTISNSVFANNQGTAGDVAGLVLQVYPPVIGMTLLVQNCSFTNHKCPSAHGESWMLGCVFSLGGVASLTTIRSSTFIGNSIGGGGGCIAVVGNVEYTSIENCYFRDNTAGNFGATIYVSSMCQGDCNNGAIPYPGALNDYYWRNHHVTISGSMFDSGYTGFGGIHLHWPDHVLPPVGDVFSSITVVDSVFKNAYQPFRLGDSRYLCDGLDGDSGGDGGSMTIWSGVIQIEFYNVRFENNYAECKGGAIRLLNKQVLNPFPTIFSNVTFTGNTALAYGAVIAGTMGYDLRFYNVSFTNNVGGALFHSQGCWLCVTGCATTPGRFTCNNCLIANNLLNSVSHGGSFSNVASIFSVIFLDTGYGADDSLAFVNTTIRDNVATVPITAMIYIGTQTGPKYTWSNVVVTNNISPVGTAFFACDPFAPNVVLRLSNSYFARNTGSAIIKISGGLYLSDTIVEANNFSSVVWQFGLTLSAASVIMRAMSIPQYAFYCVSCNSVCFENSTFNAISTPTLIVTPGATIVELQNVRFSNLLVTSQVLQMATNSRLMLQNVVFTSNTAGSFVALLPSAETMISIVSSQFTGNKFNSSTTDFISFYGPLILNDTVIANNQGSGAAFISSSGKDSVGQNLTFFNNALPNALLRFSGAIAGSRVNWHDVSFSFNTGGGIVLGIGCFQLSTVVFFENSFSPGAIQSTANSLALTDAQFISNSAPFYLIAAAGGGIFLTDVSFYRNEASFSTVLVTGTTSAWNRVNFTDSISTVAAFTSTGPAILTATSLTIAQNTNGTDSVVDIEGGSITLIDAMISANQATTAVIVVRTGTLSLQAPIVYDNRALPLSVLEGGAAKVNNGVFRANYGTTTGMAINTNGQLTIDGTTFVAHQAPDSGGAVFVDTRGNAHINNVNFVNLTASNFGGAIYGVGCVTLTNSTATNSTARMGGVIYASCLTIDGAQFAGNLAQSGGALFVPTGSIGRTVVRGSWFLNNVATGTIISSGGGAIAVLGGQLQIDGSTFSANSAREGGAVMSTAPIMTSETTYTRNTASNGGAINSTVDVTTTSCTFLNNTATGGNGGAIFAIAVTSSSASFSYNSATFGGALAASRISSSLTTYSLNRAMITGGAIFQFGATQPSTFTDDHIDLNVAARQGAGGAFTGVVTFAGATSINDNIALGGGAFGGGGVFCDGCQATFADTVEIRRNTAQFGPGFYCTAGSRPITVGVSVRFQDNRNNVTGFSNFTEADCAGCGCCPTPTAAQFPGHNCVLAKGLTCYDYSCSSGYALITGGGLTCPAENAPITACQSLSCNCSTFDSTVVVSYTCGNIAYNGEDAKQACLSGLIVTTCVAHYSCSFGYAINATSIRQATCVAPGYVPSTRPICSPLRCYFANPGPHGWIVNNTVNGTTGDIARLACETGYGPIPDGRTDGATATCYKTTEGWSNFSTIFPLQPCQPLECTIDNQAKRETIPARVFVGQNVSVSCQEGSEYTLKGVANVSCIVGNATVPTKFDPPIANCIPPPCNPIEFVNGGFQYNGDKNGNFTTGIVTFVCNPGYFLTNPTITQATCTGKEWNVEPAPCDTITCLPDPLSALVMNCPSGDTFAAYNETCLLTCQAGYTGKPNNPLTCIDKDVFSPSIRSVLCTVCAENSYAAQGDPTCSQCINGYTAQKASTALSDCSCYVGFFETQQGNGNCTACVAGAYCAGDKIRPVSDDGYYPTTDPLIFAPCDPPDACKRGNNCATGYAGYLCGDCADRFYHLSGRCVPCPSDSNVRIAIFITIGLAAATVLIYIARPSAVSDRTYGVASFNIGLNFMQIVATFLHTSLTWPQSIRDLMSALSALNLNVELAAPECVVKVSFYNKFQIQMIAPILVFAAMIVGGFVLIAVEYFLRKRPSMAVFKKHIIRILKMAVAGFLLFMTVAYLVLAEAVLSIFSCQSQVGGFSVLTDSPSDHCYDTPEWKENAAYAVLGIIFYVIGTPLLILSVFFRQRKRFGAGAAGEDELVNFFVGRFLPGRWYWEALIMVRKLIIVIIAGFLTTQPFLQVICCSVLFLVNCIAALIYKPYRWWWHNIAETVSLVILLIVMFCGLAASGKDVSRTATAFADAAAVIGVVIVIVLLLVIAFMEFFVINTIFNRSRKVYQPSLKRAVHTTGVHRGGVVAVVAAQSAMRSVDQPLMAYSMGADDNVVAWEWNETLFQRKDDLSFVVPQIRCLTTVSDLSFIQGHAIVCGTQQGLQVWASSPPSLANAEPTNEPVTAVASTSDGHICVGHRGGGITIYALRAGTGQRRDVTLLASSHVTTDDGSGRADERLNPMFGAVEMSDLSHSRPDDTSRADSSASLGPVPPAFPPPLPLNGAGDPSLPIFNPAFMPGPPPIPGASSSSGGGGGATSVVSESGAVALSQVSAFPNAHIDGDVVAIVAAGRFFYSASAQSVRSWTPKHHSCLRVWQLPLEPGQRILSLEVLENHLFCGVTDARVYDIDVTTSLITVISGHVQPVNALFASHGMLFSGGADGRLRLWTADTASYLQRWPDQDAPITCLVATRTSVIAGCQDGSLHVFSIEAAWHRTSPELILEALYKRAPFLRPPRERANMLKAARNDITSKTGLLSLRMEETEVYQLPDAALESVAMAIQSTLSRADGKSRSMRV